MLEFKFVFSCMKILSKILKKMKTKTQKNLDDIKQSPLHL